MIDDRIVQREEKNVVRFAVPRVPVYANDKDNDNDVDDDGDGNSNGNANEHGCRSMRLGWRTIRATKIRIRDAALTVVVGPIVVVASLVTRPETERCIQWLRPTRPAAAAL